jgi:hypothetical protein
MTSILACSVYSLGRFMYLLCMCASTVNLRNPTDALLHTILPEVLLLNGMEHGAYYCGKDGVTHERPYINGLKSTPPAETVHAGAAFLAAHTRQLPQFHKTSGSTYYVNSTSSMDIPVTADRARDYERAHAGCPDVVFSEAAEVLDRFELFRQKYASLHKVTQVVVDEATQRTAFWCDCKVSHVFA